MKIIRRIILMLAALFVLGTLQTLAAQTVYEVKGRVYGPDTKPIANVLVTLENNARALIGQEITNSDGRYEFNGIAAGTYYISVKPDPNLHQTAFQMIELINTTFGGRSSSVETVDFSLKYAARASVTSGITFAQTVPPEAEKEYQSAVKGLTKGEKQQATKQLARAIEIFPNYFLALQQLGLLYIEQAKYEESIGLLKKATEVNSKAARAHLGLGMAYLNLDRPKDAISALSLARQLDPKNFNSHLYLGMALISTGELDQAETSLKQALTLGGPIEGRAAHLYLASIYNTWKQYQRAVNELETYLRDNPKAANAVSVKEAIKKLKAKT